MADITLESFGDRELRICSGNLPDGPWQLPVYVIFYRGGGREYAKIAPAVGLHEEQARILDYHFSAHNEWTRKDCFLIDRKHLSKLTDRVNGITPSYYYKWPGRELPVDKNRLKVNGEEIQPTIPKEAEDFLEYVHQQHRIDRNVLRLAWSTVSKSAPEWMLKKRKPIDLGFVKLYALPFRANWKEILLSRFPTAPQWFKQFRKSDGKFESTLAEVEFQNEITELHLMAIHGRDHYVHWTMEAVPSEQWEKDVANIEITRKAAGNTKYVRFYEETISKLSTRILEVFANYVSKVCRPFPQIVGGVMDGSKKLLPYRGPHNVLPKYNQGIEVRVVYRDDPKFGRQDFLPPVSPKTLKLPEMPTLSQANLAVRRSVERGHLPKPEDRKDGAAGVLVHDGSKGNVTGECVLVEPENERTEGMEQGVNQ